MLSVLVTRLVLSIVLAGFTAAQTGSDYRSRMHAVNASGAFEAAKPDVSLLPTGQERMTSCGRFLESITGPSLARKMGKLPRGVTQSGLCCPVRQKVLPNQPSNSGRTGQSA
jgi:hypothetical protein